MDNEDLKRNIEKLREEKNITQDQMADRIGVVRNTYRNIEKGKTRLISEHLPRIARTLETTPEALLIGYQPDRDAQRHGRELKEEFERRAAFEREEYEKELAERDKTIEILRDRLRRTEELLAAKEDIISLLRKNH